MYVFTFSVKKSGTVEPGNEAIGLDSRNEDIHVGV